MTESQSKSSVGAMLTGIQNSLKNSVDDNLVEIGHDKHEDTNKYSKEHSTTPDGLLMSGKQGRSTIAGDSVKDEKKYQKMIAAQQHGRDEKLNLEHLNARYASDLLLACIRVITFLSCYY